MLDPQAITSQGERLLIFRPAIPRFVQDLAVERNLLEVANDCEQINRRASIGRAAAYVAVGSGCLASQSENPSALSAVSVASTILSSFCFWRASQSAARVRTALNTPNAEGGAKIPRHLLRIKGLNNFQGEERAATEVLPSLPSGRSDPAVPLHAPPPPPSSFPLISHFASLPAPLPHYPGPMDPLLAGSGGERGQLFSHPSLLAFRHPQYQNYSASSAGGSSRGSATLLPLGDLLAGSGGAGAADRGLDSARSNSSSSSIESWGTVAASRLHPSGGDTTRPGSRVPSSGALPSSDNP